jgi:exonuclease VII small subunit
MENIQELQMPNFIGSNTFRSAQYIPEYRGINTAIQGVDRNITSIQRLVEPPKVDIMAILFSALCRILESVQTVTPDRVDQQFETTLRHLHEVLGKIESPDSEFWLNEDIELYEQCIIYVSHCILGLERILNSLDVSIIPEKYKNELEHCAERLSNFHVHLLFQTDREFADIFSQDALDV